MYLAALWSVLGRSLWVSHLAMLPFLLGIVWQIARFSEKRVSRDTKAWLLLWLFIDPVFAGQAVMVSPDVALLFFFILGLRGALEDRKSLLVWAGLGLAAISLRGMMVAAALGLFLLFRLWKSEKRLSFRSILEQVLPLIPAGILAALFLGIHLYYKGWIGFHSASPWAPSFEGVGIPGVIHNTAVLGWRFLDHGRVGELLLILAAFWIGRRNLFRLLKENDWLSLLFCLAVFLLPSMLLKKGLLAHRYLLPLFVILHLFTLTLVFNISVSTAWKRGFKGFVFIMLLLGNLWIYPRKVSQGWEATLAHWPYYSLRNEMMDFIDQNGIPLQKTGTVFPNTALLRYIDLSDRNEQFALKNLKTNDYFFYSNVYNDLSDEEIDELFLIWKKEKVLEKWGVEVILFSSPK
jgi:hypothetical protein